MSKTLIFILIVPVILILWLISVYNSLIKRRNRVDEAWSDIEVQLKRRYNLIPNLVETVKGYAQHEKGVFENVTKARAQAMGAEKLEDKAKAENALSSTLKSLFAVAENYPQLKANENFGKLQDELTDAEDKIQAARRFHNGQVRDFNTAVQQFPTNILANAFKFEKKEFFGLEEEPSARENIQVKF